MKKFGVEPLTSLNWLKYAYDVTGKNLYEAIHNNSGYQGIIASPSIDNRYITEDVPMSLVPISSFGKEFGVKTEAIDSIIKLANIMMDTNYFESGRTVESLGLKGKTPEEIVKYLEEGDE